MSKEWKGYNDVILGARWSALDKALEEGESVSPSPPLADGFWARVHGPEPWVRVSDNDARACVVVGEGVCRRLPGVKQLGARSLRRSAICVAGEGGVLGRYGEISSHPDCDSRAVLRQAAARLARMYYGRAFKKVWPARTFARRQALAAIRALNHELRGETTVKNMYGNWERKKLLPSFRPYPDER